MNFLELPYERQVELVKTEFETIVESVFNEPNITYHYVQNGDLTKKQAKQIRNHIRTLNYYNCYCCRKFDKRKINFPIEETFEPLIDLARKQLTLK